ncbi:hypothetical protein Tco_1539897 [Tanacetum coccineum]
MNKIYIHSKLETKLQNSTTSLSLPDYKVVERTRDVMIKLGGGGGGFIEEQPVYNNPDDHQTEVEVEEDDVVLAVEDGEAAVESGEVVEVECGEVAVENGVVVVEEGAHLAPTQPTQVNKVTTSCEICSGPHDTQYCMEDLEQAFVEYAFSRTDEAGGLVSNFMASQDARLSKFEADFKQQQSEMTNKIDTVLKEITDRIAGALPSDTVKNPKLSASPILSARSYPNIDP